LSYQYDIFISYTRGGVTGEWVRNHFEPGLRGWLELAMVEQPRIFWDPDIGTGQTWPETLRTALARSRVIVPVLTYPYFRSTWCIAELNTMIAREQILHLRTADRLDGLIYPVRFHGEDFPPPIPTIQYRDMSAWAYPDPGFRQSTDYMGFVDEIKGFAAELAARIPQTPAWAEDWPERIPQTPPLTELAPVGNVAVPRL
jgi:hypothetical protein